MKIKAFSAALFVTVITSRTCLKKAFCEDFSQEERTGRLFLLTEPLISLSNHITRFRTLYIARIVDYKDN